METVECHGTTHRVEWLDAPAFFQSVLSNAVTLTSLFFLHLGWASINATEVIFLLAWSSSLTQGTSWEWSLLLFFSPPFAFSYRLIIGAGDDRLSFIFFPWHVLSYTNQTDAEKSVDPEGCLWTLQQNHLFVRAPQTEVIGRLTVDVVFSPSNQTSLPEVLTTPPHLFRPHWSSVTEQSLCVLMGFVCSFFLCLFVFLSQGHFSYCAIVQPLFTTRALCVLPDSVNGIFDTTAHKVTELATQTEVHL